MRYLNQIVLAIVLFCTSCINIVPNYPKPRDRMVQYDSAVRIAVDCIVPVGLPEDMFASANQWGSGVIISPRHILTAAHVVNCKGLDEIIHFTTADGKLRKAGIVKIDTDKDVDLALLEVSSADILPYEPPIITHPTIGGNVCLSVTVPKREWHCGNIYKQEGSIIFYAASSVPGNSGAPIYDEWGGLVGINLAMIPDGTGAGVRLWNHLDFIP